MAAEPKRVVRAALSKLKAAALAVVTRVIAMGHPTNASGNNRSMR